MTSKSFLVSLQNIIRVKSAILGQENPKWWGVQPHQGMTNGKGTDAGRIQPRPQGCIIFLVEVRCWLRTFLSSNHFIFLKIIIKIMKIIIHKLKITRIYNPNNLSLIRWKKSKLIHLKKN